MVTKNNLARLISNLATCFILAILLIVLIYQLSLHNNLSHKGFTRKFPPHPTGDYKEFPLSDNNYYIAGVAGQFIYLGNYRDPSRLILTDRFLQHQQQIQLEIPKEINYSIGSAKIIVDSPDIHLMDGNSPYLVKGNLDTKDIGRKIQDTFLFSQGVPGPRESYVFRIFDKHLQQNILVSYNLRGDSVSLQKKFVLNKQVDGVFCTDGKLQYNKSANTYLYVYYFQNLYVVLDTNLQPIQTGRTIDTNSMAKIKVNFISGNTKTISTPSRYSCRTSFAAGNWLYIVSGIRADNDSSNMYDKASVVDLYSLKNNRYLFSFYIPDGDGSKISSFLVYHDMLFAVVGKRLVSYQLNLQWFPNDYE